MLAGREGERSFMLSSPIILYDYPQIAPESAGDIFDGTEIDEILTLRVLTLSEDEKREGPATGMIARARYWIALKRSRAKLLRRCTAPFAVSETRRSSRFVKAIEFACTRARGGYFRYRSRREDRDHRIRGARFQTTFISR